MDSGTLAWLDESILVAMISWQHYSYICGSKRHDELSRLCPIRSRNCNRTGIRLRENRKPCVPNLNLTWTHRSQFCRTARPSLCMCARSRGTLPQVREGACAFSRIGRRCLWREGRLQEGASHPEPSSRLRVHPPQQSPCDPTARRDTR